MRAVPALGPLVVVGGAYALLPSLREEVDRVVNLLMSEDLGAVRSYIMSFGLWAPAVSLALMVLQAIVAPIPAFALSVTNGLAFGAFWGTALTLSGRSLAATLCLYISRALEQGAVEALVGEKAARRSESWLENWGARAVLLTWLVPFFSFDLVSYAAGLSRLRFGKFMLATVVGEVPAAIIYSWVGARAPDFIWLLLLINGAVFVAVVAISYHLRRKRNK